MDTDTPLADLALLSARLMLGGTMAAHGAQKLFGTFAGPGIPGVTQMMESLGFKPGERYARALATTEFGSGALLVLGALGPVGPAMVVCVMACAIELVHRPKGFFNSDGGFEMNAMFITIALLLATHGYGAYSLDGLVGLRKRTGSSLGWLAVLGGAGAALMMLRQRNTGSPQPQETSQTQYRSAEHGELDASPTVA